MKVSILFALLFATVCAALFAQAPASSTLPTGQLLSEPVPTFRVEDAQLAKPLTLIAYGDQRFTDPAETRQTNPRIRQWLVHQIAAEHPDAVIMNGDLPLAGNVTNDYAVFRTETKIWRDLHMHVFPVLGNHEFTGDAQRDLENWWTNFPELRNRRWYS